MVTKAQNMKDLLDVVQSDLMYNVFCDFDFKQMFETDERNEETPCKCTEICTLI